MKPRDPRFDPAPGDLLERGGIRRLVLSASGDLVAWELPGLPREGQKSSGIDAWRLWAKGALVRSPETTAERQVALSRSARSALDAMWRSSRRSSDGWVRPERREDLMREAGIGSRNTWARAASELEGAGLVTVDRAPQHLGRPTYYRLTGAGLALLPEPGLSQGEPGGLAQVEPGYSEKNSSPKSLPFQKKEEITPSRDPGPLLRVEPGVSQVPWLRSARQIARGLRLIADALDGEAPDTEDETRAGAPPPSVTPKRSDGLRWDETTHPELAQELARFRSSQTTRTGARPWEDSRRVEVSWVQRAYAHAAWRLLRPPRDARPVRDAWGLYLSTLAKLVSAQGDGGRLGLEFGAMLPNAEQAFLAAREELRVRDELAGRRAAVARVGVS